MMRTLIAIAAFIFYAGFSALPAQADFMNGRVLASLCASDVDWESGGCVGYIVGVADAFDHLHFSNGRIPGQGRSQGANARRSARF